MKVIITETDISFFIELKPEDMKEIGILIRMSLNAKKEIAYLDTFAFRDSSIETQLSINKTKEDHTVIKR